MLKAFKAAILALLVGAAMLVTAASAAQAEAPALSPDPDASLLRQQATSPAQLQEQVDLQLRLYPGGKQINDHEVAYDGGKFVITFAQPGRQLLASPDCPSGWFCFYDYANYGYPRGKLSDCGWQDLSAYGWHDRTSSVHNRTSSTVAYDNHTVGGHDNDEYMFSNFSGQASSLFASQSNKADHVYRYC
ncbi:peptidase inhibitor family I36 protein [Streptosporangium roseum]|uniref:peptidase inhibitor family I36 protein n=1 Tax=Streptosporangium roseum TaxID=2001 RepID=UPI003333B831